VHTVAEGLASARGTCRELESAGTVDDLDDIARRMENSLSGRYFVDAAVRWVCPDQEGRVDELIESGVVDYRALCDEDEGDIGCAGGWGASDVVVVEVKGVDAAAVRDRRRSGRRHGQR
jgi:hypothetical protein